MTIFGRYLEVPTGVNGNIIGSSNRTLNFLDTNTYVAGEVVTKIAIYTRATQAAGPQIEVSLHNFSTSLVSPPNHIGSNKVYGSVITLAAPGVAQWQEFTIPGEALVGVSNGDILGLSLSSRIGSGGIDGFVFENGAAALSGDTPGTETAEVWNEETTGNNVYYVYIETTSGNILVDYTGTGTIELGGAATVEFYEGILVDYEGEGIIEFSGTATVQEFNPANILVQYTGVGEITLDGEAIASIVNTLLLVDYIGFGGLGLSGSADSFTPPMITGSGGVILTGAARVINAPGNPYLPNDRWTNNVQLQAEFLYGRLLHQKKNFGSRDSIVYIEGTPQAEVIPVTYNCLYDSSSGEVRLYVSGEAIYEVLFVEPELVKLDLTFDVNGRPVVVYQVGTEIWLHTYDTDLADYTEFKIADGTQPFICWDERREEYVTTGDILVIYKKDTSIFMRKSRDNYLLEYATSVLNRATDDFTIQGFGMTVTHRMQIRVLITKVLED